MRVDSEILRAALTHPDLGLRHPDLDRVYGEMGVFPFPGTWVPAGGSFLRWAEANDLPPELVSVFQAGWPNRSAEIGVWTRFWSPGEIQEHADSYPQLRREGLLVIGASLNGDWIAIDIDHSPGAIGYLGLTQITGDVDDDYEIILTDSVRTEFLQISPSLGAFVLGVVKDALPIDSYGTWSQENSGGAWSQ